MNPFTLVLLTALFAACSDVSAADLPADQELDVEAPLRHLDDEAPVRVEADPVDSPFIARLEWTDGADDLETSDATPVVGYLVHVRTPDGNEASIDVGLEHSHSFEGLPSGTSTFWLTSYDAAGEQSPPTAEFTKTVP